MTTSPQRSATNDRKSLMFPWMLGTMSSLPAVPAALVLAVQFTQWPGMIPIVAIATLGVCQLLIWLTLRHVGR